MKTKPAKKHHAVKVTVSWNYWVKVPARSLPVPEGGVPTQPLPAEEGDETPDFGLEEGSTPTQLPADVTKDLDALKEKAREKIDAIKQELGNRVPELGGKLDNLKTEIANKVEEIKNRPVDPDYGVELGDCNERLDAIKAEVTARLEAAKQALGSKGAEVTAKLEEIKAAITEKISAAQRPG